MSKDDNVIELHPRQGHDTSVQPIQDSIVAAVMKLKEQPIRQVNWRAVITFLAISMVAMASAALVPAAVDSGLRWPAAMALVVSVLSAGAAALYRYSPSFWVPLRVHCRPLRRPAS